MQKAEKSRGEEEESKKFLSPWSDLKEYCEVAEFTELSTKTRVFSLIFI